MKKTLILITTLLMTIIISGCSSDTDDQFDVLVTTFPIYDWVLEITDDIDTNFSLDILIDTGVDLHSYQPTNDDIIQIHNTDVLIYTGGESEEWILEIIESSSKEDIQVINLMDYLDGSLLEEETPEGVEAEEEEEHDHEDEAYDEHIWLSLKNAITIVEELTTLLCNLDSSNSDEYSNNSTSYLDELKTLDELYETTITSCNRDTLLFGDRFPFLYLFNDYNINYYAAFSGCSAETEASYETIAFLVEKVNELDIRYVLIIDGTTHEVAQTVIANSDDTTREILVLDSMQSTDATDISNGVNYLDVMTSNLEIIKKALN